MKEDALNFIILLLALCCIALIVLCCTGVIEPASIGAWTPERMTPIVI